MTALGEFRGTLGASCAPCNGLKSVYDDDGGGGADDHNEIFLCVRRRYDPPIVGRLQSLQESVTGFNFSKRFSQT